MFDILIQSLHLKFKLQPALLYIVPLCLIFPLTVALIQGDLKSMFTYRDHEDVPLNTSTTSTGTGSESNSATESPKSSPKVKKTN